MWQITCCRLAVIGGVNLARPYARRGSTVLIAGVGRPPIDPPLDLSTIVLVPENDCSFLENVRLIAENECSRV